MIGNLRPGARAVSLSNGVSETPHAAPETWARLCAEDNVGISDIPAFHNDAVEALLTAGRVPATPEDCADVIYWCAQHGAHRVLARVVAEWPSEVTRLELSKKTFRRVENCDDSVEYDAIVLEALDTLERATCFVLGSLLCKDEGGLEKVVLKNLTLGEDASRQIAHAIESSRTLTDLSIQNAPGLGHFARSSDLLAAAAASGSLRCLRLRQSLIDGERIAQSLASLAGGRLIELDLEDAELTVDASNALATALESGDCHLSMLSLVNCFQDAAGIPAVLLALKSNTTVEVLDLSCNDLGAAAIDPRSLLAFNGKLKELRLCHTWLADTACAGLGQTLAANPALAALDLSWNGLKSLGPLVAGLPDGAVLESLNLTLNPLEKSDGDPLADLLRRCDLQSLDLSSCKQPEMYAPIFAALGPNTSLTSLRLNGVGLTTVTPGMLEGLAQNRTLASLDLRGNALLDADVDSLIRALDHHRISLQISGDKLPENQYRKFASALCLSSGITSLVLQPGVDNELALLEEMASRIGSNFVITEIELSSTEHFAEGSAGARAEARIADVTGRNSRSRPGIDHFFEQFVSHRSLALPAELGPPIRAFVEGDEVGAKTLHAMRVVLPDGSPDTESGDRGSES